MANPNSLLNGQSMAIDSPSDAGGIAHLKLSIGEVAVAGTADTASWQGVATHPDEATFAAGDGVTVIAGVDGTTVIKLRSDADGKLMISAGGLANGAVVMVGGVRTAITASSIPASGVLVKAYSDNGATVYVGTVTVTADKETTGGYPLEPGASVGVPCSAVGDIYIVGTGTDGVAWIASAD
jgi:hypothetical protein